MKRYSIEVYTHARLTDTHNWLPMKPSGHESEPYSWDTKEEAEEMKRICHPLALNSEVRVVDNYTDEKNENGQYTQEKHVHTN